MLHVKPDFFYDFKCIASRCKHSCCLGWEIDIDEESLARFMSLEGEFGSFARSHISLEPDAHFVLGEDERCPFLRSDGLCRMILELGEDSLCHICREHPRFYNELPGRLEAGLGLCCEEAARLLLEGDKHLELIAPAESEDTADALLRLREEIFSILAQDEISLSLRMEKALALFGMELLPFEVHEIAGLYLGLERLEADWGKRLEALARTGSDILEPRLSSLRYARLAEYFVYRHFATAPDEYEAALRLQFAFLSARLICALDGLDMDTENTRLYSAEIEYSDENVDKILDWIDEKI